MKKNVQNKSETTGLSKNLMKTNHVIDFNNLKILDEENNSKNLEWFETTYINIFDNNVNLQKYKEKIRNQYQNLISIFKDDNFKKELKNDVNMMASY